MKLTIHTDGGARGNPGPAGAGISVTDESDAVIHEAGIYLGIKTNNEAEYLALFHSLNWLSTTSLSPIDSVQYQLDSKLVVEQIQKHWKIKEVRLQALAQECWQILRVFPYPVTFKHVLRAANSRADQLANQAMDQGTMTQE